MSARIDLINVALLKAGISQTLVALTDQTREAFTAAKLVDPARREVLRAFPWAFATRYADAATAAAGQAMSLFAGSATTRVHLDWQYAYRYPTDALMARRLVEQTGRVYNPSPTSWRVGRNSPLTLTDPVGDILLIYTNAVTPLLEYTADVDLSISPPEPLFEDVLTTLLASRFALSLARDPKLARELYALYLAALPGAETVSAREQQLDPPADTAEWHAAR